MNEILSKRFQTKKSGDIVQEKKTQPTLVPGERSVQS